MSALMKGQQLFHQQDHLITSCHHMQLMQIHITHMRMHSTHMHIYVHMYTLTISCMHTHHTHARTQPQHLVNNTHNASAVLFLAQWGFTALLRAACNGYTDVVQMLLDSGSTLDEVTNVSVHPAPMSTDSV